MSCFIRVFSQRLPASIRYVAKSYHQASSLKNIKLDVKFAYENEITQLVQKMIIPINPVPRKPNILDKPCINIIGKIDSSVPCKVDIQPSKEIMDPGSIQEKKAHRMLIIKRKKMNKHKYKKKQKKYRYVHMGKQREKFSKNEAALRKEIYGLLQEAYKFSAEEYVAEKLKLYRREVITNRIHGCRMPPDVVKEFLEKRKKSQAEKLARIERRKQMIAERGSLDVDVNVR